MNSNENLKITVITVVFNDIKHIEETIKSVTNQTYDNIEYVIIDGGSKDGSVDVIKKYADNIDYWVSEPDDGIYDAMNKGILKSTGDYVHFLNSGDTFYDMDVIFKVTNILRKKNVDLIYGDANFIYSNYNVIIDSSIDSLKLGKGICHQTAFIKNSFISNNIYDTKYKSASDFDLFCKMLINNYSTCKINSVIVNYQAGGFSSDKNITYFEKYLIMKKYFGVFNAYKYYILKIFFEQGIKNTLQKLGFNKFLSTLIEINNKR